MARKRNPEKDAFWRDVFERQTSSGLSIRQFCAAEDVSEPSFFAWRRKLQGGGRKSTPPVNNSGKPPAFIPLALVDSPSTLEVIHPLGYRIRVSANISVAMLSSVLDVIDGRVNQ